MSRTYRQLSPRAAIVVFIFTYSMTICAADPPRVRWEDVEKSIGDQPAIRLADDEVAVAEGEIDRAKQYPNPELDLSLGQARAVEGEEQAFTYGVELSVPIDSPHAYRYETKAARAEKKSVQYKANATRLGVFRRLRVLFLSIGADQARVRSLQLSQSQIARLVDVARTRVQQGEARPMELTRLEIELEQANVALRDAVESASARRHAFALQLGAELPGEYLVEIDLEDLPALPPLEEVVEKTLNSHPSLKAASSRIDGAAAKHRAEQHRRLPEFALGAFFDRELDAYNYGGMLSLKLPLWNWNSGAIAKASAEEQAARRGAELTRLDLEIAVRDSFAAATRAYRRTRSLSEVILPKLQETSAALEQMYRVGEIGVIDILDARRTQIEVEAELTQAWLASQLAYLNLRVLMGVIYDV